jgi:DNA-binding response OmpR family regulator
MTSEQHRRVLIVEDDEDIRNLLLTALRQRSLIVDRATDGEEAISLLRDNAYAVILLDLLMPVKDGFDVLDAIGDGGPTPPVVLVVTGADRKTIEKLDARRIHGVVRKPFDPEELAAVVAACADIRSRRAFETMAIAGTVMSGPLFAWFSSQKW